MVRGEDAGLHFLVGLDTRRNDRELARLAQEAGIRLSFLTDYGGGEEHWLVVNYPGAIWSVCPRRWNVWQFCCKKRSPALSAGDCFIVSICMNEEEAYGIKKKLRKKRTISCYDGNIRGHH